jgi:hypothetical protein
MDSTAKEGEGQLDSREVGARWRRLTMGSMRERFCAEVAWRSNSRMLWLTGTVGLGGCEQEEVSSAKRRERQGRETHPIALELAAHHARLAHDLIDVGEHQFAEVGTEVDLGHLSNHEDLLAHEDAQSVLKVVL